MHLDLHPLLQKLKKPTFNILNNIKYVVPQNKFCRQQLIEFKQIVSLDDQRWVLTVLRNHPNQIIEIMKESFQKITIF